VRVLIVGDMNWCISPSMPAVQRDHAEAALLGKTRPRRRVFYGAGHDLRRHFP
jgi:hypothetical protein